MGLRVLVLKSALASALALGGCGTSVNRPNGVQTHPTTAGEQYAAEIQLVLEFATEVRAGKSAEPGKLRRLEDQIASRQLLNAGDVVSIKSGRATLGMPFLTVIALNAPKRPYHVRVDTTRGQTDMLVYRRFFGVFMYLEYYIFHGGKLVGMREGDLRKPVTNNGMDPVYIVTGSNIDIKCEVYTFTEIRCKTTGGHPVHNSPTP